MATETGEPARHGPRDGDGGGALGVGLPVRTWPAAMSMSSRSLLTRECVPPCLLEPSPRSWPTLRPGLAVRLGEVLRLGRALGLAERLGEAL